MDNIEVTGTRSYITVKIDGKILKIKGELTTTPAFYADSNSIITWEPPNENMIISHSEKQEIINRITKATKGQDLPIYFD